MKKVLIAAAIVLAVALLAVRFIMTESGGAKSEREWFVTNLRYGLLHGSIMLRFFVGMPARERYGPVAVG